MVWMIVFAYFVVAVIWFSVMVWFEVVVEKSYVSDEDFGLMGVFAVLWPLTFPVILCITGAIYGGDFLRKCITNHQKKQREDEQRREDTATSS